MTNDFLVLGSGMAGLGAAAQFAAEGRRARVLERKPYAGGHTATHVRDGFVFDEGPHVSFTKMDKVKSLFAKAVADDFLRIDAKIDNYWQGHYVRHPVITSLNGLPRDLVVRVIADYVEAKKRADAPITNYEDWLVASYGRTYAETFPMKYAQKYHTTLASNMSTEWVGPRLYQAKIEEVLAGALTPESPNIHYVQDYRYPRHGGFAAFLSGLIGSADIELRHEVAAVDPKARTVTARDGRVTRYDGLVSSIPLPDLVPMIAGVPSDVLAASQSLACTSVVLVNLGVAREDVSQASWTYFYDEQFPFSRVSFPRTFSPHVAPAGCSSIQAEVYFSKKYRPLEGNPEDWIEPTIEGLRRCGTLRDDDRIVYREAMWIPYANIIFDLDRAAALAKVHGFLDDVGIGWCGRYGEWGYLWSDEAFVSGENAARKALERT
ncbi:MAG TPA: FAD-dependent oxidoreductase [Burkholderiaceae bacterium]